jgi:hypothetical protein
VGTAEHAGHRRDGLSLYGCVTLIAETRLALRSVKSEMEFTLILRAKYQERRAAETEKEAARPGVSFHLT